MVFEQVCLGFWRCDLIWIKVDAALDSLCYDLRYSDLLSWVQFED